MTGILSRKREFAVLQSVGMTNRQLKNMLVYEGLFYAVGSIIASLILSVAISPMLGNVMSDMFWFVSYHFTIMPVIVIIPVFLLLGWLIPAVLYHAGNQQFLVFPHLRTQWIFPCVLTYGRLPEERFWHFPSRCHRGTFGQS